MAATAILIHFRSHQHRRFLLHNATSTVRFYSSSDDNPISSPNSDYSVTDIKTTENTRTTSFHNPIPNTSTNPNPKTASLDEIRKHLSNFQRARVQEELDERLQKVREMEEKDMSAGQFGPLRESLQKLSTVEQTKKKEEELDERLQKVREMEEKGIAAGPLKEGLKKLSCVEQTKTKEGSGGCLYVKVSMDGAPYLRTIDLKTFHNYAELFKTIEKMFSCFTLGHPLSEGIKNGSQWVLTHEDKDGDWMLVGDVPWEMFIDSCKRLRIMKTSKAIG